MPIAALSTALRTEVPTTQFTEGSFLKRFATVFAAAACFTVTTTSKPADAQISVQLPFVSLGMGAPAYYPY